jgi:hypothetical protein
MDLYLIQDPDCGWYFVRHTNRCLPPLVVWINSLEPMFWPNESWP